MSGTVFALSTAPGRAAIAVVRVTGPDAHRAAERLAGKSLAADRRLVRARLRHPLSQAPLDDALVVCFEETASYTGEAVAEFHLHGGRAVVNGVLAALDDLPELSPAEPGAFTRRAFEAGRLDLSQVESVADLIDAETQAQRAQALALLDGALSKSVEDWRAQIVGIRALLEAAIDFADEDLPDALICEVHERIVRLDGALRAELDGARSAQAIRDGFEVALVGPPNVGKSTLINSIAKRDVALISEIAGTTRDVLEARFDLGGLNVTFLDMAGLRESDDPVERAGVLRARDRAAKADLRIFVSTAEAAADRSLMRQGDIAVTNKCDAEPSGYERISALSGEGVQPLLDQVSETLQQRCARASGLARARHIQAVGEAREALGRARVAEDPAIIAEEMRCATTALERIIGIVDVDHILGEIFSRFCLGK